MQKININHPQWIAFWNSAIEFKKPTPEVNRYWAEIEDVLLEWPNYQCAYLFIDAQGGQYVIAKEANGRYGTHICGWHSGEAESFDSFEEAAMATFADWFPEGAVGEWDDDSTQFSVDGVWLIKE